MDYQDFKQQLPQLFNNWGNSSCSPKLNVFQLILTKVDSMISVNVMQLLNFAVSCLDENEVYCEVGTFQGSSLISALINNYEKNAYAVDNFSELELDLEVNNFDRLTNNLENFNLTDNVFLFCQDFEEFFAELKNQESTEKIGVYFYDGSCNYRSHLLGLLSIKSVISDQAIIIITNCQWSSCQQAIRDFLSISPEARLMIDFSQEDYLLWNGTQILSWDTDRQNDNTENYGFIDSEFKTSITNITKEERIKFIYPMQTEIISLYQNIKYAAEIEQKCLHLLKYDRTNATIWQNLGVVYYQQEQYTKALDCLNKALIINGNESLFHYTIGLILEKLQAISQSIQAYQKSIELNPKLIDAYNNLSNVLLLQGEIEQAEQILKQGITINSEYLGSYLNLGNLLINHKQEIDQAIVYYEQALKLNIKTIKIPNPNILNNLRLAYELKNDHLHAGLYYGYDAYFHQDKYEEAIAKFTAFLAVHPGNAFLYKTLIKCYRILNQHHEALELCKQAIILYENNPDFYILLGDILQLSGKTQEAILELQKASELFPENLRLKIQSWQTIPINYENIDEIEFYRENFCASLDLLETSLSLNTDQECKNALDGISQEIYRYLAYQCKNDTNIKKQYGQIVHKIMMANYPQFSQPLSIDKNRNRLKIRIGYLSYYLCNHNGANWSLGWIKNHNRYEFEIYCYNFGPVTDFLTEQFKLYSDFYFHIPGDIEKISQQVLGDKLDILVFPAIESCPLDTQIAALRLAPIQCTAWGGPLTSGLPTVDYYLSSDLMELENAQEHYSEELIRLPNSGLCYPYPMIPDVNKTRADFELLEDSILYLCCQSTWKYLPQYDYIFPSIAQQIKNPKFVFLSAPQGKYITEQFQKRLYQSFTKFGLNGEDYCVILPRQNSADFLQLMMISDIFLDTFGWNGGNTTLQAIACNLPVVTCPGEFMRGRHSYAFLKMLDVTDTIANSEAEYIEIAVKLALHSDWKNSILEKMKTRHHNLYEDLTCVKALEEFYKSVVNQYAT